MSAYVFGARALDLALGVSRAVRTDVYLLGEVGLPLNHIRAQLGVADEMPIDVVSTEPPICCCACATAWDGRSIIDRRTGSMWKERRLSFDLFDEVSTISAAYHSTLIALYPEIPIDSASLRLLRAKLAFAASRSPRNFTFAEVLNAASTLSLANDSDHCDP